ncbi:proline-rich protein HaeIII subfamily 1-like [Colius striatus]|uniref:proline-rich protein HaeIII subfamily 1-like n=1 Tax=Colius striatus TaxID=57412 RepID=UPI002B1DCBF7|nr:proline-rich protein HaeIII subfamily 1-like [Colius striatus]
MNPPLAPAPGSSQPPEPRQQPPAGTQQSRSLPPALLHESLEKPAGDEGFKSLLGYRGQELQSPSAQGFVFPSRLFSAPQSRGCSRAPAQSRRQLKPRGFQSGPSARCSRRRQPPQSPTRSDRADTRPPTPAPPPARAPAAAPRPGGFTPSPLPPLPARLPLRGSSSSGAAATTPGTARGSHRHRPRSSPCPQPLPPADTDCSAPGLTRSPGASHSLLPFPSHRGVTRSSAHTNPPPTP